LELVQVTYYLNKSSITLFPIPTPAAILCI
jgi:hypothetical protein